MSPRQPIDVGEFLKGHVKDWMGATTSVLSAHAHFGFDAMPLLRDALEALDADLRAKGAMVGLTPVGPAPARAAAEDPAPALPAPGPDKGDA